MIPRDEMISPFGQPYYEVYATKVTWGANGDGERIMFVVDDMERHYRIYMSKERTKLFSNGPDSKEIPWQ